jgi:hypothetical protein
MSRFQLLLLGSLALLGLSSCGDPQASAPETSSTAAVKTEATANSAAGFTAMQNVTDKTTTDVKAGKFDQAKTDFEKFEDAWKTVEDGVKVKSSKTYAAIEAGLDSVNGELKNKQPDKAKLLTALQSLSQNVVTVAKP